jgi:lipoprotein-anchoring transpeptidase ErfK/SrfK
MMRDTCPARNVGKVFFVLGTLLGIAGPLCAAGQPGTAPAHGAAAQARPDAPLQVTAAGRSWTATRGELAQEAGLEAFVGKIAKQVRRKPVDAALRIENGRLAFREPAPGQTLDEAKAKAAVQAALQNGSPKADLPLKTVPPKVLAERLGSTLVVNLSENRIYLYRGFKVDRSYPVATALPPSETPRGEWKVVARAQNPTWHNPAPTTWGADRPPVIPGGRPENPLGSRALYLNAPGDIRIHATIYPESIGSYASHGCIRMFPADIEALYPSVPVGTKVLVVGTPPPLPASPAQSPAAPKNAAKGPGR